MRYACVQRSFGPTQPELANLPIERLRRDAEDVARRCPDATACGAAPSRCAAARAAPAARADRSARAPFEVGSAAERNDRCADAARSRRDQSTTRSITLRSSRTLPGHGYAWSASIASGRERARHAIRHVRQEVLRKQRDVDAALAQRRKRDADGVDAIEQIVAEASVRDALREILIARRPPRARPSRTFCVPPTRKKLPCSSARSELALQLRARARRSRR